MKQKGGRMKPLPNCWAVTRRIWSSRQVFRPLDTPFEEVPPEAPVSRCKARLGKSAVPHSPEAGGAPRAAQSGTERVGNE